MYFLHPWALAIGAAAVGLPVVIHWLTRPRPRTMPLSTIRFVRQILQQKRATYRLRDWLVLLLRAAAVVLVAMAFARPLSGAKPLITPGEPGNSVRVIVLDSSQSTAAVNGGVTLFERGRATAADYLKYQAGLRASLLLSAAKPRAVFDEPSLNLAAMRQSLAAAQPRSERLDVQAAIDSAAKLLATSSNAQGNRVELVIISDFQRSNWSAADFSGVPKDTKIQFVSISPQQSLANLAITRVGVVGQLQQGREAQLQVEIGNFSRQAKQVQVEVMLGQTPYRAAGLCPPQVKTTLTAPVQLPSAGWLTGRARLVNNADALPADDVRPFVLGVRTPPVYALLTREPSRPHASSSHFVERALVPLRQHDSAPASAERVIRLDPTKPDSESLAIASMIVIDHPGKLPADTISTLAGLMRRGRGVLYLASESVDASNLKLLADAAGSDLKMPVEFIPSPANMDRRDLFLAEWKKDQSPFSALGEDATALLGPLRFAGGLASRQIEGGLNDDVLARFSDRSAALVVTTCGAGTLAVFNADLGRSSLASSGAFVPMMSELVSRMLAARNAADAAPSGEMLSVALPPEVGVSTGLSIEAQPDGKSPVVQTGAFSDSGGLALWRWNETGPPGVYTVMRGSNSVFAIATAAPSIESDLEPLDPAILQTKLAGGHAVYFQSAGQDAPRDDTWAWALSACAIVMIGEVVVLRAFQT